MNASPDVLDLVRRWAAAEQQNDGTLLDGLLADDFVGVGPLGFLVPRDRWLARFEQGLENRAFAVEDPDVRGYGQTAVVIGVLTQQTSYQGRDNSGRFRVTLVCVRPAERWLLANVHIGPLQPAPGP